MADKQVKVVFTPSGRRGSFPVNTPLLHAARVLGVDIDSVCGGRGLCGRCQITCAEGAFPKHQINSDSSHLSAVCATEIKYGERKTPLSQGRRLSCHTLLLDDVVIDVPPESQVHRQIVRKDAEHRDIILDPSTKLYYVHVEEPDMHVPKGDLQRLIEALEQEWQLSGLNCDNRLLKNLQPVLAAGKREVTVAVHKNQQIIALWPGFHEKAYGVAVDVGSTTIAAHLCDLASGEVLASASTMNPQIRFGEDLMSRVSYVMMHPEGADEMTVVIRQGLNQLFLEAVEEIGAEIEDILEVSLVANPIMHHILLGVSPVELGGAPFALTTDAAVEMPAAELDLNINGGGRIYILPCIAGHVGADTAGMILSEEPQLQDKMTLLVDVGTNAEIVLGNSQRLLACSSPTGPAFEGAQISCGQRAATGAIERVRINSETLEPRFKVIGSELWSDEEGFTDAIANHGVTGICGSGIIEVVAEMYLAGIVTVDGIVDGDLIGRTSRIIKNDRTWSYVLHTPDSDETQIVVTQNDIRQIQLAKAALYAGVKLLMDHIGTDHIERIRLAGAFGSHINVQHAMVLGLIPDCVLEQVSSAGNAAGTGARIALLNAESRNVIETLVKNIEKIETALEPKFQDYFVDAMAFPNKKDPFPNLFSVVDKPKEKVGQDSAGGRKRRRR
ncbi:MAG: ASKHA domain-containing protein [Porticoccaceae bacterium]|nr:ASKHA domain-containing protein [Porticoccaceae bacterium]|tara:strand:+ start:1145 stop:3157 length:2013 start_codon:yes stop_codon:yes gene_type:complete